LPKAGKYEYPFFDLDSALEKLKKLHDVLHTDEINRDVAADTLGMAVMGGGFAYLISSMEKYGLVKTGSGKLVITERGKLALYGDETEKEKAKCEAVLSVELFDELFSQYGKEVTAEQIKAFLRQKALVDVIKAQKLAQNIDKIYKNVANYIVTADKLERPQVTMAQEVSGQVGRRFDTQGDSKKDILKIQYGSLYLEVEKEDAENALKMIAQKLGLKLVPEKSD
jgi:hypothetical protein